ncbi:hypothetical protein AAFF_G00362740 [Aldrovandia affinis]|uniref:Uncharacterized protein n=1 Tax=Aldrovandia affinis TaxID=143900 RepID=A0AAD7WN98_9TELE|nr:hypothetical protein AAFF_G00362740 [Aldrovandia affinis]
MCAGLMEGLYIPFLVGRNCHGSHQHTRVKLTHGTFTRPHDALDGDAVPLDQGNDYVSRQGDGEALLILLPNINVLFEQIRMNLVGPLSRSERGHQYLLVVVEYTTWYSEATVNHDHKSHCQGALLHGLPKGNAH